MNFGLTSEYDILKTRFIKKHVFTISASEAKRAGCNPAEEKKERNTCTANSQIFSTVSTWEGNFRVYSLYCRLPQPGGAKREISLWVLLNADRAAFQGCLCNSTGKMMI